MDLLPNTFLTPTSPPPAYDADLDDLLAVTVCGVTGMVAELVRPRWQPDPPPQPDVATNWCAVGVTSTRRDTYSSLVHSGAGDGSSTQYRCEEHTVSLSFFGPAAEGYATLFADGVTLEPNRYALNRVGIDVARCGDPRNASALVLTENLRRFDVDLQVVRRVARTYAVPNVQSVSGTIVTDNPPGGEPRLLESIQVGSP